jgi:hypothetical protein
VLLLRRPAISLTEARGLYAQEHAARPFYWTSSLATLPVHNASGLQVAITLVAPRDLVRQPPRVTLSTEAATLASFIAPDRVRTYRFLLPPSAAALQIHTPVVHAPEGDPRLLGVQLLDAHGRSSGFLAYDGLVALLAALISIPVTLAASWLIHRGYGSVAAITGLGLILRAVDLQQVPAGFFQDEAVSLVDALHLASTGHDHLGHLLPLGALEAFGDWISPLFTYLAVPLVALFGPHLLVVRLLAVVAGVLAIPAGYALARALKLPTVAASITALAVAISPWQILRTRAATPPALVPLCWTLCLWAAVRFIQRGGRKEAVWLALAAGIGIYAYPTMKLAVPLLVGLAILLALLRHSRRVAQTWILAGIVLALMWLPFAAVTLLNDASSMRASSKLLRADTPGAWLAEWAAGYSDYFLPGFYYETGDPSNGMPDEGVQLVVEAPLVLLGLGLLVWRCISRSGQPDEGEREQREDDHLLPLALRRPIEWWLVAGALLIAPLPASLMTPNPQLTRALLIAPLYTLLVGCGAMLCWSAARYIQHPINQAVLKRAAVTALIALLLWQGVKQFRDYLERFPAAISYKYQDGMFEAMQVAVRHAPEFDEVWIDDRMTFPYIFVLAAQPMPPEQAQAQIKVIHGVTTFNTVTSIGRYHFANLAAIPNDIPVVETVLTSIGGPGFVLQEWQQDRRRVLLVRRMR